MYEDYYEPGKISNNQEDIEITHKISNIGLLGNTLGSEANRLLSNNSMSTLIINGGDLLKKPLNKDFIKN